MIPSVVTQVRKRPTLFYRQEWYLGEPFAGVDIPTWDELTPSRPPAAVLVDRYVRAYDRGEILWPDHYVWTGDRDREGNWVYVGRSRQYNGLQIHRHLANPDIRDP